MKPEVGIFILVCLLSVGGNHGDGTRALSDLKKLYGLSGGFTILYQSAVFRAWPHADKFCFVIRLCASTTSLNGTVTKAVAGWEPKPGWLTRSLRDFHLSPLHVPASQTLLKLDFFTKHFLPCRWLEDSSAAAQEPNDPCLCANSSLPAQRSSKKARHARRIRPICPAHSESFQHPNLQSSRSRIPATEAQISRQLQTP